MEEHFSSPSCFADLSDMNHANKEVLCEGTCEGSGEKICKIPDGEDLREVAFLPVDVRIESTRRVVWAN